MEIKDGMIDITWLGPELWFGVRLGEWILIAFVLILSFLAQYVFAGQGWYKSLNSNERLQQRLFYVMAVFLLLAMGYLLYLLGLEVLNGIRDNGFVWVPQGVLVFSAVVLLYAKGSLLLRKPADGTIDWRESYVGVFRDGLELGIVGLLFGLATGDRAIVDEMAFAFGLFGIVLSVTGKIIRCFRLLRRPDPLR